MLVGMEMDAERMSNLIFAHLPLWAMGVSLAIHLAIGLGCGVLYFQSLWWNAQRLIGNGGLASTVAISAGRLLLMGAVLLLIVREGAPPLLATAVGIMIARPIVTRRARREAP
jgi:F1F0 ATPase subunit 2